MRNGTAILATIIVFIAGCGKQAGHRAHFEGGGGWLISKIPITYDKIRPVGDGERVWLLKSHEYVMWDWNAAQKRDEGRRFIVTVDRSGRVSTKLPWDWDIDSVLPLGDGNRVVVTGKGLSFIDSSSPPHVSRNLLPAGVKVDKAQPTPEGVWVAARSTVANSNLVVYFVNAKSLVCEGPWTFPASYSPGFQMFATLRYLLVMPGEYNSNGLALEVVDRLQKATAKLDIKLTPLKPSLEKVKPDGRHAQKSDLDKRYPPVTLSENERYAWIVPHSHKGVARIDLAAVSQNIREGKAYDTPTYFRDQFVRLDPLDENVALARIESEGSLGGFETPDHVSLIDLSAGEASPKITLWRPNDIVSDIQAVDHDGWLVNLHFSDDVGTTLIYTDRSGDFWSLLSDEHGLTRIEAKYADKNVILVKVEEGNLLSCDRASKSVSTISAVDPGDEFFPDKGTLWIRKDSKDQHHGILLYNLRTAAVMNAGHPFFARALELPRPEVVGWGTATVVGMDNDKGILDTSRGNMPLELILDDGHVSSIRETPDTLSIDPNSGSMTVKAVLPGWPVSLNPESKLDLHISCGDNHEWVGGAEIATVTGEHDVLGKRVQLPFEKPCRITVTFSDVYGSRIMWRWSNIKLTQPLALIDRPWFRSVLVFSAICLLALVGASLRGGLQRWIPLGVYVVGGMAGVLTGIKGMIDLPLLCALIIAAVTGALFVGILSSSAFRELERIEPFRSLAPWALSVSWMRRRLYADYVERLGDDVSIARERSNLEVYAPIPLRLIGTRRATLAVGQQPAAALLAPLAESEQDRRAHVYIESTGGRGKSALIREVVSLAVETFKKDPRTRLPIMCEGEGKSLFDRAREKLGTDGFSDELLRALMRAGEFFLIVDGVTESRVDPAMLREQFASFGTKCPILLAGRPNETVREVVEGTKAWLVVEPQRLDDNTLKSFVKVYGRTLNDFSESAREACRHRDGTYLPILVRLALLPSDGAADNVAEIYRNAITKLLDEKKIRIDDAIDLSFATYWKDGQRQIVYAYADEKRKALLSQLLAAGLLIPAEIGLVASTEPRMVRFFHDTMQSYLTAVALSRNENWRELLLRAAGAPEFVRDASDLVHDGGSELFQMCLYVFEPKFKMIELMHVELLRLASEYGGSLNRDWVVEQVQFADLTTVVGPRVEGGDALLAAVELARKDAGVWSQGALYAAVVRHLWPKIEAKRLARTEANGSAA